MKMVQVTYLLTIKKWLTVDHKAFSVSHAVLAGTKPISTQAPRAAVTKSAMGPSQPLYSLNKSQRSLVDSQSKLQAMQ